MALLEPGFLETEYGRSPAETVRLETRWLVQAVLDLVWREYDLLGDALLTWLFQAVEDVDPLVRLRVAAAAGWLAQYDFASLRQRLLLPWALGSSRAACAAADALGLAAWSDATGPMALGLLDFWSRQDDEYDLWWTASVAYGGEIGVRYPGVAMDQLHFIVLNGDPRAPQTVARSVVRLVASGGRFAQETAAHVFHHLEGWIREDGPAAHAARRAYAELLAYAADPGQVASSAYWRLLAGREVLEPSARLLRATLAERTFRLSALDSIESLVRGADRDDEARTGLEALLLQAATGPGAIDTDRDRLVHYLARWAGGEDPSPAARHLEVRLEQEART